MKKTVSWILAASAVILLPFFITSAYTISLTAQAGTAALAALGLYLLFARAGQISLGQAGFMALGAYGYLFLHARLGLPLMVSLILPAAAAIPAAYLIGMPLLRLRGHVLAMGTLAFGEAVYLSARSFSFTGGPDGMADVSSASVSPAFWHISIWILVIAAVFFLSRLRASREGRALRVLHDDEDLAASFGYSPASSKTRLFIFSAVLAAAAGSFQAGILGYAGPDLFEVRTSLMLLLMAVIGGAGHPVFTVIAAAGVSFLPEMLSSAEDYQLSIFALILIAAVLRKNPFKRSAEKRS